MLSGGAKNHVRTEGKHTRGEDAGGTRACQNTPFDGVLTDQHLFPDQEGARSATGQSHVSYANKAQNKIEMPSSTQLRVTRTGPIANRFQRQVLTICQVLFDFPTNFRSPYDSL